MSDFASLVRNRVGAVRRGAGATAPIDALAQAKGELERLMVAGACPDTRCADVLVAVNLAGSGTAADARTALTRVQSLLRALTEEDANVASDESVQAYRRALHALLDH